MKNKPIHIVEAYFSDWDSSHFEILGIFTDINQAIKHEKKWTKFYALGKKRYQELYQALYINHHHWEYYTLFWISFWCKYFVFFFVWFHL